MNPGKSLYNPDIIKIDYYNFSQCLLKKQLVMASENENSQQTVYLLQGYDDPEESQYSSENLVGGYSYLTEEELAGKICQDQKLVYSPLPFFLMKKHLDLLKNDSIFDKVLGALKKSWSFHEDLSNESTWDNFTYDMFTHLYTKILKPINLLSDIRSMRPTEDFCFYLADPNETCFKMLVDNGRLIPDKIPIL
jgi:hypothetical protein